MKTTVPETLLEETKIGATKKWGQINPHVMLLLQSIKMADFLWIFKVTKENFSILR